MLSLAEPMAPVLLFIWIVCAFWGLGRLLVRRLSPGFSEGRSLAFAVHTALGMAAFGQALFLLGCWGNHYRGPVVLGLLTLSSTSAAWPFLSREREEEPILGSPGALGALETIVLLLAAVCLLRWFLALTGFVPGSDVFSHHYAHAKDMIRLGRFGHIPRLPNGWDHISNYNPALMHLIYMLGMLVWDERVSNLLHWLTQLQLMLLLYGIGAAFSRRSAGLFAVAAYLGIGLQGNFPLDVQDYTFAAVLLMIAAYGILRWGKTLRGSDLALAAVAAGFMLSTKYYGLVLLAPLAGCVWLSASGNPVSRFRASLSFILVALAVFSPWLAYNLVMFKNPIFPFFSNAIVQRLLKLDYSVYAMSAFVAPTDSSIRLPRLIYYLSLFIPFEPGYLAAGLSPVFLLGLPCSLYAWRRSPGFLRAPQGLLFLVYLCALALIEALAGWTTFYKWSLFPGCAFAVSMGLQVGAWSWENRRKAWVVVLLVAGVNYWFNIRNSLQVHAPAYERAQRWSPLARYINERLEPGAAVGNADFTTGFYLRPDLKTYIGSGEISTDWDVERSLIERNRMDYYVDFPGAEDKQRAVYVKTLGLLAQLKPGDKEDPAYVCWTLRRFADRTLQKNRFLADRGTILERFDGGPVLYRLAQR